MRISDWSSDVCSSDLGPGKIRADRGGGDVESAGQAAEGGQDQPSCVAGEAGARNASPVQRQPQLGMKMPRYLGPGLVRAALVAQDDAVDDHLLGDRAAPGAAGESVVIARDPDDARRRGLGMEPRSESTRLNSSH